MDTEVPLMPESADLPEAVRDLRDARWRRFVWFYVFNGGVGSDAARNAGYSDVKEAAKVRAHALLQRVDIQAGIASLTRAYLFSLAPKAVLRLNDLLDDPKHSKHAKAIEMTLSRTGHGEKTEVEVNVNHRIDHTDAAVQDLQRLRDLGVPRETLVETFGHSGLARYERMLAERQVKELPPPVIDLQAEEVK